LKQIVSACLLLFFLALCRFPSLSLSISLQPHFSLFTQKKKKNTLRWFPFLCQRNKQVLNILNKSKNVRKTCWLSKKNVSFLHFWSGILSFSFFSTKQIVNVLCVSVFNVVGLIYD
jgi:hypothetical protein